jgi:hypothetical protein
MRKLVSIAVAGIGLFAAGTAAKAADPAFCQQYATLAVHEYKVNLSIPGCFKGNDNRWHADYMRHYNWCLTATRAAADAERDYRRMRLDQCRMKNGQ